MLWLRTQAVSKLGSETVWPYKTEWHCGVCLAASHSYLMLPRNTGVQLWTQRSRADSQVHCPFFFLCGNKEEKWVLCVRSKGFAYFTVELDSKVSLYPLPRRDHLVAAWKALRACCWHLWCPRVSPVRQACCINLHFL